MKIRALLVVFALVCAVAGARAIPSPSPASAAPSCPDCVDGQNIASESYYRFDVPAGTMSVTVEALVQNTRAKDTAAVFLLAMPSATNVTVKLKDGAALPSTMQGGSDGASGHAAVVTATLPSPLKSNGRVNIVMTYTMGPRTSELVRMQPGSIEAVFASQGPGSFVLLDVPVGADNYFDPGCLKASDQPADVQSAGLERWACGEVTLVALLKDDASVQRRCANLEDSCRQRTVDSAFSAFAQSITDTSLKGLLEAEVPMADRTVKMRFSFFRRDQAWAEKQFAIAQKAFPKLEAAFAFPYPYETIQMRQSHHIEFIGAAGIAFWSGADVLLTPNTGFDDEVTVHELSHQWAGGRNMSGSWITEGLAEWATRVVGPALGITPLNRKWESFGYDYPISLFGSVWDTPVNPSYWYGKSGAFWFAFEAAVGGSEKMRSVLGQIDDKTTDRPVDGRWFMDKGERASGAKLDELFLTWVWNKQTAGPELVERRAAHNIVDTLWSRSHNLGLFGIPTDITSNLDAWQFKSVAIQVEKANKVLDRYEQVTAHGVAAGLPPSQAISDAWGVGTVAISSGLVDEQRQAIDAIASATRELATEPADSPSAQKLADARLKYAAGDLNGAKRLAAGSTTSAYNEDASGKMIELAKQTQAAYKPSFLGRIGLFFKNPDADLVAAQKAYDAGEYEQALNLARGAHETWVGADRGGIMRLAILMALMCGLSAAVWWLLKKLDPSAKGDKRFGTGGRREGHQLTADEHKGSWKDWSS